MRPRSVLTRRGPADRLSDVPKGQGALPAARPDGGHDVRAAQRHGRAARRPARRRGDEPEQCHRGPAGEAGAVRRCRHRALLATGAGRGTCAAHAQAGRRGVPGDGAVLSRGRRRPAGAAASRAHGPAQPIRQEFDGGLQRLVHEQRPASVLVLGVAASSAFRGRHCPPCATTSRAASCHAWRSGSSSSWQERILPTSLLTFAATSSV